MIDSRPYKTGDTQVNASLLADCKDKLVSRLTQSVG